MTINKMCTECGGDRFDVFLDTACCTNCNHTIAYVRRQAKTRMTVARPDSIYWDNLYLTSKGWLTEEEASAHGLKLTYNRLSSDMRFWLSCVPSNYTVKQV